LTRALQEDPTEPRYYQQIFERGIDPDVEDPEQCHSHSEIPDEWPQLDEILDYSVKVRNRARSILKEGSASQDRTLGEALWIGFEHEAMHLETFLYMLLQSDKTLPPTGVERPNFEEISRKGKQDAKPNKWFRIPAQTVIVGLDDCNEEAMPKSSFGWDNEKPQRTVNVHAFEAQARPITNGEYKKYLQAHGIQTLPASWVLMPKHDNPISKGIGHTTAQAGSSSQPTRVSTNNIAVRTIFGPVPLEHAHDWPLSASYDELADYAKWMNCRIPTFEEAKSIYQYAEQTYGQHFTNGYRYFQQLCHFTPESNSSCSNGTNGSQSHDLKPHSAGQGIFRDLKGCNIGFKNWHPVPVTPSGDKLAGQGGMGGVWEWTSTPLMPHEGFKSMEIYPGYTCESWSDFFDQCWTDQYPIADFFDGKHNIILGGSWATLPRTAGRTSL
jgi:formylglycine-generating enzyme required for sulfatase activity